MRDNVLKLLETKGNLPPFPDVLMRLQKMISDPDVGISEIARLIELDPMLAGNILKIANSAYYSSGGREVKTLSFAISKLGLAKVKQVMFSLKLSGLFADAAIVDYRQFWRHSLAVANFTQALSKYTKIPQSSEDVAYLSGLMHDVGIMVFIYLIPEAYGAFLKTLPEKDIPIEKQEAAFFGIDHQEAGALFIEKWWKVDPEIIHAVRYHHFPFAGTVQEKRCAQLVHLANGICNSQGITNGIECFEDVFSEGAWEALGLSLEDTENIIADVNDALLKTAELLGFSGGNNSKK